MNLFIRTSLIIIVTLLFSGCSSLNCTRLEGLLGAKVNLIHLAERITDTLVQQALPPLTPRHPQLPILTTTFVNNDKLEETSRFSRQLQENMSARLVQLGYTVREIKLRETMHILPGEGERILSRDLSLIDTNQPAQAILLGTYSLTNRILYISARLVNPENKNIISAHSYRICMDDNLLAMFGLQRPIEEEDVIDPPSESIINKIFY